MAEDVVDVENESMLSTVDQLKQQQRTQEAHSWFSGKCRRLAICMACAVLIILAALFTAVNGIPRSKDAGRPLLRSSEPGMLLLCGHDMLLAQQLETQGKSWSLPSEASAYGGSGSPSSGLAGGIESPDFMSQAETSSTLTFKLEGKTGKQSVPLRVVDPEEREGVQQAFTSSTQQSKWVATDEASRLQPVSQALEALLSQKDLRQEIAVAMFASEFNSKVTKLGAGLFLKSEGDILLLRKNSTHNNGTLTVPGGNADLQDPHLRHTAEREAVEEMGSCPNYTYKGEIETRRGKHDQKMFLMYLGELPTETRYNFRPQISHETLDWGWFPLKNLHKRDDLHPTVKILVKDHAKKVKKIFGE